MIQPLFVASVFGLLTFVANAAAPEMPGGPRPEHPAMDFMQKLTDEQRECIKAYGCEMPAMPDKIGERPNGQPASDGARPPMESRPDDSGDRPHPQMTDEQRQNMECMHKAMESCGVELPSRPERPELAEQSPGE